MSDHYVTIVDIDVELSQAPARAAPIIAWLQAEGIIGEATTAGEVNRRWLISIGNHSDNDLTADRAVVYPPGPNYRQACNQTFDISSLDWLEVQIERQVFTAGENGIGILCASCHADQYELGNAWGDAINDWYSGGTGMLACAACSWEAPLRQWTFDPVWAFGNLGLKFKNWSLEPNFVADICQRLGSETRVVHMHL
jgi:hypothetical protein